MIRFKEYTQQKTEKYLNAVSLSIEKGERILKVVHLHPIFFLKIILIYLFFGVLVPAVAFYYLNFVDSSLIDSLDDTAEQLILVGFFIYSVTILTFSYVTWIDDYFDTGIITNLRVVDIDQTGLFGRKVTQIYYENIQDASAKKNNIWQNIFNYGTVLIQSGGEKVQFRWVNIPKPFEIAGFLLAQKNKRYSDLDGANTGFETPNNTDEHNQSRQGTQSGNESAADTISSSESDQNRTNQPS